MANTANPGSQQEKDNTVVKYRGAAMIQLTRKSSLLHVEAWIRQ